MNRPLLDVNETHCGPCAPFIHTHTSCVRRGGGGGGGGGEGGTSVAVNGHKLKHEPRSGGSIGYIGSELSFGRVISAHGPGIDHR